MLKLGFSLQVNFVPRPVQLQPAISAHAEFVFCDQSIDITYVPTAEGWLYLAVVLDLYSRRIVGWAMSDSLHRQLVIDALQMALTVRQPPSGLLHHSDQGSQYASDDYQALLTKHQMVVSISTLAKKSKGEEGLPK